jgi:Fur family ferric uptake transcriptional regulator
MAGEMNPQMVVLVDALESRGYRLTAAREAILRALVRSGGHIKADDLVAVVHEDAPHVGRMTVYRTLDLLVALGAVHPVYQGSGAAHYVLLHEGHHHHLVCTGCQAVIEFDDCALGDLSDVISGRFGFKVQGHLLELYGLCPDCHGGQA